MCVLVCLCKSVLVFGMCVGVCVCVCVCVCKLICNNAEDH